MDLGLRRIQNALLALNPDAVDRNTLINFAANNLYGMHDLLRVGRGVGGYLYGCGSDLDIFRDIGRASNIALILAGGAKGVMGALEAGAACYYEPKSSGLRKWHPNTQGPELFGTGGRTRRSNT
jgi:hypothetical protein